MPTEHLAQAPPFQFLNELLVNFFKVFKMNYRRSKDLLKKRLKVGHIEYIWIQIWKIWDFAGSYTFLIDEQNSLREKGLYIESVQLWFRTHSNAAVTAWDWVLCGSCPATPRWSEFREMSWHATIALSCMRSEAWETGCNVSLCHSDLNKE